MTWQNQVTIQETIDFLNKLLLYDRTAITQLFFNLKVACNDALADHPTVQVLSSTNGTLVGELGILNGLFGVKEDDGYGQIVMVLNDEEQIEKFIHYYEFFGED